MPPCALSLAPCAALGRGQCEGQGATLAAQGGRAPWEIGGWRRCFFFGGCALALNKRKRHSLSLRSGRASPSVSGRGGITHAQALPLTHRGQEARSPSCGRVHTASRAPPAGFSPPPSPCPPPAPGAPPPTPSCAACPAAATRATVGPGRSPSAATAGRSRSGCARCRGGGRGQVRAGGVVVLCVSVCLLSPPARAGGGKRGGGSGRVGARIGEHRGRAGPHSPVPPPPPFASQAPPAASGPT